MRLALRIAPLLFLALLVAMLFFLGGFSYVSFENLKLVHGDLLYFLETNPVGTTLIFFSTYVIYAVGSIPGLLILDLIAGYLFGPLMAIIFVVTGATVGATLVFLATKYAFIGLVRKKSALLEKIQQGFHKNSLSYLIFLRVFPFLPFGAINIALAFMEVKLSRFVGTTILGLLPVAIVSTHFGTGLGAIFNQKGSVSVSSLFNTQIIIAFAGLGILALTPILYKKYRRETP